MEKPTIKYPIGMILLYEDGSTRQIDRGYIVEIVDLIPGQTFESRVSTFDITQHEFFSSVDGLAGAILDMLDQTEPIRDEPQPEVVDLASRRKGKHLQ